MTRFNTQGGRANRTGKTAERTIACVLKENEYDFTQGYRLCESIYGHPLKTDFFIRNVAGFPDGLAIESKWQQIAGSNDEKFPYLVTNIKQMFPCPAIVVVDGNGQKPGALRWLRGQTDEKLIAVFNIAEFIKFVNSDMPEPTDIQSNL